MWATVGDRLVVKAHRIGDRTRDAEILEALGPDGSGPFRVRWEEDGHESIVTPGSDAWVQHLSAPEAHPSVHAPRSLAEAPVRDHMRTDLISCSTYVTVAEALAMLVRHRIHCVAVQPPDVDSGTVWPVLSDLDLIRAALAGDDEEPVGRFCGRPVVYVRPDDTMAKAGRLMVESGARHLVVREPLGARPLGILSTMDVAALAASLAGAQVIRRP
jgi:CBS domain-containing protein